MATNIILKRTATPGNIPTIVQLDLGEVGINTFDGKLFIKKNDGSETIRSFINIDSDITPLEGEVLTFTSGSWEPSTASGGMTTYFQETEPVSWNDGDIWVSGPN